MKADNHGEGGIFSLYSLVRNRGKWLIFPAMLGGAVVTESLYTIPGIGTQLVTAIKLKDTPSVMGCTFILAALCSIILLIVDLLYAAVDPRIKAKYSK